MKTLKTENTEGYKKLTDLIFIDENKVMNYYYIEAEPKQLNKISKNLNKLTVKFAEFKDFASFLKTKDGDLEIITEYIKELTNVLNRSKGQENPEIAEYKDYFKLEQMQDPLDVAAKEDDNLALEVAAAVAASENFPNGGGGAVRRRRRVMKPKN
jgi:hypothetical protein